MERTVISHPLTGTPAPSKGLPPSADGISTLSSQPSEQSLAAPRVWHRLVGSAKSVVRNLDPATYSIADWRNRWKCSGAGPFNLGETLPQLFAREEKLEETKRPSMPKGSPTSKASSDTSLRHLPGLRLPRRRLGALLGSARMR